MNVLGFFMPHLTSNTVYDRSRLQEDYSEAPPCFESYAPPMLEFAQSHAFKYPYLPFPQAPRMEVAL